MGEIIDAFAAAEGGVVQPVYGASGLLRERIEMGERADVFASADFDHPRALAAQGVAAPPKVFTRNRLCALAAAGIEVTSANLLNRMLDPQVKLGTSTPKADPSGDYAWQLFERAERIRPGSFKTLDTKALKLTGGPNSPAPPTDRSAYAAIIAARDADIFLTYCTNAMQAVQEVPGSRMIAVPDELAVGADYGVTIIRGAPLAADRFATFLLSAPAQRILARHGFSPVDR